MLVHWSSIREQPGTVLEDSAGEPRSYSWMEEEEKEAEEEEQKYEEESKSVGIFWRLETSVPTIIVVKRKCDRKTGHCILTLNV